MSRPHALLLVPVLALSACTAGADAGRGPADRGAPGAGEQRAGEQPAARVARPTGVTVVPGAGGAPLAAATSRALFQRARVVVVAPAGDLAAQARASSVAVALGTPLLLSPSAPAAGAAPAEPTPADPTAAEVERLGADTILAADGSAARWAGGLGDVEVVALPADPERLAGLAGAGLDGVRAAEPAGLRAAVATLPVDAPAPVLRVPGTTASEGGSADAPLPDVDPARRLEGVVVLASRVTPDAVAAVATARAAGADVHVTAAHDPRADRRTVQALASREPAAVLGLGDPFGPAPRLQQQVRVARTGVELPGGGQLVLPGKLYVALYGHPGSDALGALGEQGVQDSVARAQRLARDYQAAGSTVPVVPTFEIITTVASAALGDGDYSDEAAVDHVRPYVEAAGRAGVYVVLDLQPGYDDFLTQAKMYEELLALPHVGLALDPEWRLRPGERHLRQIGRVGADEVNRVVAWLADLTRDRGLPQKMLLLHQFKTYMLEDRERIVTTRPELTVVTQMDGHGSPGTKLETWGIIRPGAPPGMRWGWKNFYDEDRPTLTPAQTLAVRPTPVFVSYQ